MRNAKRLEKLEGEGSTVVLTSVEYDEERQIIWVSVGYEEEFDLKDFPDREAFERAVKAAETARGRVAVRLDKRLDNI